MMRNALLSNLYASCITYFVLRLTNLVILHRPGACLNDLERFFHFLLVRAKAENTNTNHEFAMEERAGQKQFLAFYDFLQQATVECFHVAASRAITEGDHRKLWLDHAFELRLAAHALIQPLRQLQLLRQIL